MEGRCRTFFVSNGQRSESGIELLIQLLSKKHKKESVNKIAEKLKKAKKNAENQALKGGANTQ